MMQNFRHLLPERFPRRSFRRLDVESGACFRDQDIAGVVEKLGANLGRVVAFHAEGIILLDDRNRACVRLPQGMLQTSCMNRSMSVALSHPCAPWGTYSHPKLSRSMCPPETN
jgi:hypothetical protein